MSLKPPPSLVHTHAPPKLSLSYPGQLHGLFPRLAAPLGNKPEVSLEQSSPELGLAFEKPWGALACSATPCHWPVTCVSM